MGERDAVGVSDSKKWEFHSEDEEKPGENEVCFTSAHPDKSWIDKYYLFAALLSTKFVNGQLRDWCV
jgi:hypothetical protein